MSGRMEWDAVVVGAGPNGLAAAITLAQAGLSAIVFEGKPVAGGGMRSGELTLPGFVHDICSAVYPLTVASPFFRSLPLRDYAAEWIYPPIPMAHPFDTDRPAALMQSVDETAQTLDEDDNLYRKLFRPLVSRWNTLLPDVLAPLQMPRHPFSFLNFAVYALQSADGLLHRQFKGNRARAFFAGLAAHSNMPLEKPVTAAFGLVLGILGHAVGWPVHGGGSQKFADALVDYFKSLGGTLVTGHPVKSLEQLPAARALLLDVGPRQLLKIAGTRLPGRQSPVDRPGLRRDLTDSYRYRLQKYRYGPGVFKIDWALSEAIPFKEAVCRNAGTVHIGGSFQEIALAEQKVWSGKHPQRPFVILVQPTVFDAGRAPEAKHTAWAYCHVPSGSTVDMTEAIENQVERFAPGFRDCVLARHSMTAREMERYNPNNVGGDINGGVQDFRQLFGRPAWRFPPYATPAKGLYLCSASTPPGGGVHGMCGYHAARTALQQVFGLGSPRSVLRKKF